MSGGGCVQVVGAGLAGLSAAVQLMRQGRQVRLHEAAAHAGGRCRSFEDATVGRLIDNGNHLLLSGNTAALDYLAAIGAGDSLDGPEEAAFPFLDLASGERWTVRLGDGRWPGWIFDSARRVPGTRACDYLRALKLARAGEEATVADVLGGNRLFERFWEPLAVSVLNTETAQAAARPLWRVLRETVGRGGKASRPLIARHGLGESFVAPAIATLQAAGVDIGFGRRLRAIEIEGERVRRLRFGDADIDLEPTDSLVLAVPPWMAADLLPGLQVPDEHRAIVNGHFRLPSPRQGTAFLGLLGGVSQWLFVRGDVASITVSAADALAEQPAEEIAPRMWREVARALDLGGADLPPQHRILKEKRATIAQTPAQLRRRPPCRTGVRNLLLAGDWTDTGLPATIEGAIQSGRTAAGAATTIGQ